MNLNKLRVGVIAKTFQYLPSSFRGKARLARLLLGKAMAEEGLLIRTRKNGSYLVPGIREPVGFHLLVDGSYEVEAINFLLSKIQTGDVFIDVGANVGAFTLPLAKKIGQSGCVLAIEAAPAVFPYLQHNIDINQLDNVFLKHCAAFWQDGAEVSFYEAPTDHFGMGSLAVQFTAESVKVVTRTLDSLIVEYAIDHVDVIKVDVEGFEIDVFKGASNLLAGPQPPLILFEFCDWAEERTCSHKKGDAQRYLITLGYRLWRLSDLTSGKSSLTEVITNGFETLVAVKS